MKIVDAHHHVWDLARNYHPWLRDEPAIPFRYGDYTSLRRDYLPTDYLHDARGFDLLASVYVEAEWDPTDPLGETRWIHEQAEVHGVPGAVVAQAWLDRDDVAEVLAAQAQWPLVRSIRHKPRAANHPEAARRGEPGSMDDVRWRDGYALLGTHGLHFDLQTPWWHFDAAADLARDFPGTCLIVNHAGLPADRSPEGLRAWRAMLAMLAAAPNARIKISGIGVPGQPWSAVSNRPVVRDVIAVFGADRAMFASNYPVDSLVAGFDQIFNGFDAITADLPSPQRDRLFFGTALETYRPVLLNATSESSPD